MKEPVPIRRYLRLSGLRTKDKTVFCFEGASVLYYTARFILIMECI
jgi:hypothetical protein